MLACDSCDSHNKQVVPLDIDLPERPAPFATALGSRLSRALPAPRVGPHVEAMRLNLGRALDVEPGRISVKATTHERLGALGREEGIAAMAVALMEVGDP